MSSRPIPYGSVPNKDFESNDTPYLGTKLGIITRVDELHLKVDVKVISGSDERYELDMTQAMAGPRSFLGGIPEVNSLVIIGYRRRKRQIYDAVILGYVPVGSLLGLKFDPFAPIPPNELDPADAADATKIFGKNFRYKRIKGQSGDIFGMSSRGAEMHLSKDVRLTNRAGDLFELRDVDRTLISQTIHRVESDSAAYLFSGPVRRGAMNLPLQVFTKDADGNPSKVIKDPTSTPLRYFGGDELGAFGIPPTTLVNAQTKTALDRVNDTNEFPPVTFSNGRQAFYASSSPATNFEDPLNGGALRTFTERRLEIRHEADLLQEVLDEIDGFSVDRPRAYIEQVLGTVVGNDAASTLGQRQYGRVLKPKVFEDFDQIASPIPGFALEECLRPPSTSVDEALTMAAAYLLRIKPPRSSSKSDFAFAVSKQGKVFANIPGSASESYLAKNVSAEINMEGALKARIGAASPDRYSIHLTTEGGIFLDVGSNADGQCLTMNYRGAVKNIFRGGGNSVDDVAHSLDVQGNAESHISGNDTQVVNGKYLKTVSGGYNVKADAIKMNALNGFTAMLGGWSTLISGKTQNHFAQLVIETIALGGKLSTVLAGAVIETLVAGAKTTNVLAGATTFNNPAGAFTVTVGTGAVSITTASGAVALSTGAGAMSIAAGGGAVAITAGLAMNLTATTAISLAAPQVLLGGPAAALGIARGLPMMPPGSPSLDWITGLPLQGSAVMRSI